MKKSLYAFLIFISALLFTGCSTPAPEQSDTEPPENIPADYISAETETEIETESRWMELFDSEEYINNYTDLEYSEYGPTDIVIFDQIVYNDHDISIQLNSLEFKPLFDLYYPTEYSNYSGVQGIKLNFHVINQSDNRITIKNTLLLNDYPLHSEYLYHSDNEGSCNTDFYIESHSERDMIYTIRSSKFNFPLGELESAYRDLYKNGNMFTELGLRLAIFDDQTGHLLDMDNALLYLNYDMNNLPNPVETNYQRIISEISYPLYEDDNYKISFYGYLELAGAPDFLTMLYIENKTGSTLTISYGDVISNDTNAVSRGFMDVSWTIKPYSDDLINCSIYDHDRGIKDYEFISFKLWIEENAKKPVNEIPITLPVYFEELWQGVTAMNGVGNIIYK